MKKLFILIPAMLLTLGLSAAETPVAPGTNAIKTAVAAASAGDVLILSTGTYNEEGDFSINKNITIQAADGEHPEIVQTYYFRVEGGAQVTFKGIKFKGTSDHCIRSYTASTGEEVITLEDCEFSGYTSYVIYTQRANRSWDAVTIRNCYFHNNAKSAVYITKEGEDAKQSCNSLTIENSTFADMSTGGNYSVIYFNAPEAEHTATLSINHCTFYNHPYLAIEWNLSSNVTIKNSIFAQPTTVSQYSVSCVAGSTIDYCLAYKTNGYDGVTSTNDRSGNPYFIKANADNYDFSVASFSPAHATGEDDENLGDIYHWTSDDSAHPTTVNISAGTDAIKTAVEAAWPDDEIILAAGTYNESANIVLDQDLTIKADDDATPTVVPAKSFVISNGADVTIQGLKFDVTSITGHFIDANDATSGNELTLERCEFYNYTPNSSLIHVGSSKKLDACTINNCYFHNINKSCFFNENTGASNLTVTNSTFANITTTTGSYWAGVIDTRATSGTFSVDHCTFYNVQAMTTDYAAIGQVKIASGAVVSNCIFAMPTSTADLRAIRDVATANNCLTYNYTKDSNWGIHGDVVKNNCIQLKDPLFADAANSDFSLAGDFVTPSLSPARYAGTDGSHLGDPRWYSEETLPSTDLASPYAFIGAKAVINGSMELDGSSYIHSTTSGGNAIWKVNVTKACAVLVTLNMSDATTSGHNYQVEIFDADGNSVGALSEGGFYENTDDKTLVGSIYLPAVDDYKIVLTNAVSGSKATIKGITLTYDGGAVQTITNSADFETDLDEAWFSSNGTRADGKISFPGSSMASAWVRWNVHVSNNDYYDITVNFDKGDADHNCGVKLYNDLTTVFDKHATTSSQTGTASPIRLGRFYIPEGDYIMEFTNPVTNSTAKLISVEAQAFDAPVISLPNTLPAASAITSELAYEDGGELYFTPSNKKGYILDQWAKWKVSVAAAGTFLFTMNVNSSLEQSYEITILDSENNELDSYAKNPGSGEKTIKHYFNLAAGNYFVMVQNTTNHSDGHMVSMVVSQPELVTLDEAETSNVSWAGKTEEETTYDVQIIRTIKAGMYNTFCLPFEVTSSQCKDIFGSNVKLRTLDEATVEEGDFVLNLNFAEAHDIYPGTPVLIQTSRDIVNPVFTGVKFTAKTPSATTKTNANFTGTFIKSSLEASEDILFLGANNTLYFPTASVEIKGMRGWFVIHGSGGGAAPAIRSARIVENEQVITAIDLVNGQETKTNGQKLIENGQLYILYNGQMYNVQGARVK